MMRLIFILTLLALFSVALTAQPVNDDCDGIIDLGVAPFCPDTVFFNNVNATPSDIGFGNIPSCFNGGGVQNDVWFAFTTSDTIFDYTITVTGISDGMIAAMSNPQIALYRGECEFNGLADLGYCGSAANGDNIVEIDVFGLTPNVTYFLRINDYSATGTPNWGSFQLCIDEMAPSSTIDEGGSTLCSGELLDTGGADGDYGNDENHVFVICPTQPHECITFTLDYYNIEPSGFDVLTFYDNDQASGPIIGQLGGFDFFDSDGGGGVCYQVQATSGCLTVEFTSDAFTTFEGFQGHWECSNDCEQNIPITVTSNIEDQDIIDFVSTPVTTVEITDINCASGAFGLFEAGDDTDLGLERGLLLSTGNLDWAVGPNFDDGFGNSFTADNGFPGDPDLDYLSTILGDFTESQDACIVELDVFVATDELTFEYVFGSEEYPEYVNLGFNDIFAFLISGPGIVGDPNMNNQQNIAVLPDGSATPVQINSVNNLINWEYYRNNENGISLQYDGLTSDYLGVKKSLTARSAVTPCNTYHLKLAIADRGDGIFDSGVFIAELEGGTPELSINFNSGIDYLVEDCTNLPDELIISISSPSETDQSYNVVFNVEGTATPGFDYLLDIPSTVTIPAGVTQLAFPITVLSDLEIEGTETIIISLTNNFGCGEVTYTQLTVNLEDQVLVNIQAPQDTVLVCANSSVQLEVSGASSYFWQPVNVFDDPTSSTPIVTPPNDMWISVQGNVGPCADVDSVFLQIVNPILTLEAVTPIPICRGESVQLQVSDNVNHQNLTWLPETALSDPTSPTPIATPQTTTIYIASVEVSGCVAKDTLMIPVVQYFFPEVANDTLVCQNFSVQLAEVINTNITLFSWTPTEGLDNPTSSGPIATPEETTTYQLIAASMNGFCRDTAYVTVTVAPADVQITNPDSLEICLGEMVELNAITSTGSGIDLVWTPDDGSLSETSGLYTVATPTVTNWYFATFNIGDCVVMDSIFIRVDSLPAGGLEAVPMKETYCQGEIVQLVSNTYEPSAFPDIMHQWLQGPGYETSDTLWNMVITTLDTFIYQRITTNRACSDTAEIEIIVIEPPIATLTPQNATICPGDQVSFLLEISSSYEEFTWMGDGLSCTDCFDPTASPTMDATYSVEIKNFGCDLQLSANVAVIDPPVFALNTINSVCPGGSLQLNFLFDDLSTYTWTSTDPDFGTVIDDPNMPLVVTPNTTTTYFLVADNGFCPPVEAEVTVQVIPQATVNIEASTTAICEGDPVTIQAVVVNGSNDDSFTWTNSINQEVLNTQQITVSPEQTATYFLNFSSGGGCDEINQEITITVNPSPTVAIANDTIICLGESVQLNYASDENSTYVWTAEPGPAPTGAEPIVSPTQTTLYTLTAASVGCEPVVEDVLVEVIQNVNLNLESSAALICSGDAAILTATVEGGSSGDSFEWIGSDGSVFTGPSITVSPFETTTYTLQYTSGGGCQSITDEISVSVEDGVSTFGIDITPDSLLTNALLGDMVTLTALYETALDAEDLQFTWLQGDSVIASGTGLESIDVTLLQEGDINFSVQIETPTSCDANGATTLNVKPTLVDMPNAFTPNGDNTNDFFSFVTNNKPENIEIVEFKIFNRWGQLVYDNENPSQGWNGTYNGKDQPSDVYVYYIQVVVAGVLPMDKMQGEVTLLR
ncbi:MAG TPA: choice-of-anchor L domain-containing protein [Saprospiraceae bacterium]|nr:choice-of-anchor L domain-containing protein [Saprospiraceae bacterium]HMQ81372.1 choice-of-anchor L domain-containing protein [Saprospiraceae bacterium]